MVAFPFFLRIPPQPNISSGARLKSRDSAKGCDVCKGGGVVMKDLMGMKQAPAFPSRDPTFLDVHGIRLASSEGTSICGLPPIKEMNNKQPLDPMSGDVSRCFSQTSLDHPPSLGLRAPVGPFLGSFRPGFRQGRGRVQAPALRHAAGAFPGLVRWKAVFCFFVFVFSSPKAESSQRDTHI